MDHDEMIAVITAAKEGKRIRRRRRLQDQWKTLASKGVRAFDFSTYEYEVVPEPREWWLNAYPHGVVHAHTSHSLAELHRESSNLAAHTIHVREVIEGTDGTT